MNIKPDDYFHFIKFTFPDMMIERTSKIIGEIGRDENEDYKMGLIAGYMKCGGEMVSLLKNFDKIIEITKIRGGKK